jgi:cytochrome c5
MYCAQCHMNADSEAPQLDEADDWDMRTYQWTAILKDHVQSGFLGMPTKGGQTSLSSQSIDDALYYMDIKLRAIQ